MSGKGCCTRYAAQPLDALQCQVGMRVRCVCGSSGGHGPLLLLLLLLLLVLAVALVSPACTSGSAQRNRPASSRTRPASSSRSATSLLPADTTAFPSRGCGPAAAAPMVTFEVDPDGTHPECLIVNSTQRLRVVNNTNGFGQRGSRIVINFARFPARTVSPGTSTTFDQPFGDYYAVGEHLVRISTAGSTAQAGIIIWLK
jgi:hypothetical protein